MSQAPDENFFEHAAESAAEKANIPKKMKIDLETPLEIFFWVCFGLACLGVLISGIVAAADHAAGNGNIYEIAAVAFMAVLAGIMFKCRRETDNYYVLDNASRKLLYHYRFFSNVRTEPVADFDDIACVGVGGTRSVNKGNVTWTYHIYAIDKKGARTCLSNMFSEGALENGNAKCRGIASVIGCACVEGRPQTVLAATGGGEEGGELKVALAEYDAAGAPRSKMSRKNVIMLVSAIVAIDLIITAVVIALVVFRTK